MLATGPMPPGDNKQSKGQSAQVTAALGSCPTALWGNVMPVQGPRKKNPGDMQHPEGLSASFRT